MLCCAVLSPESCGAHEVCVPWDLVVAATHAPQSPSAAPVNKPSLTLLLVAGLGGAGLLQHPLFPPLPFLRLSNAGSPPSHFLQAA